MQHLKKRKLKAVKLRLTDGYVQIEEVNLFTPDQLAVLHVLAGSSYLDTAGHVYTCAIVNYFL